MQKTRAKHKPLRSQDYDLYEDLRKISSAFGDATRDAKGKAGAMLTESLYDVRERSSAIQEQVTDYVTRRPLKSIGYATLAGLVAGYLLRK